MSPVRHPEGPRTTGGEVLCKELKELKVLCQQVHTRQSWGDSEGHKACGHSGYS